MATHGLTRYARKLPAPKMRTGVSRLTPKQVIDTQPESSIVWESGTTLASFATSLAPSAFGGAAAKGVGSRAIGHIGFPKRATYDALLSRLGLNNYAPVDTSVN